jgi:hypothetical protein
VPRNEKSESLMGGGREDEDDDEEGNEAAFTFDCDSETLEIALTFIMELHRDLTAHGVSVNQGGGEREEGGVGGQGTASPGQGVLHIEDTEVLRCSDTEGAGKGRGRGEGLGGGEGGLPVNISLSMFLPLCRLGQVNILKHERSSQTSL